jgi:hypothetical protein
MHKMFNIQAKKIVAFSSAYTEYPAGTAKGYDLLIA